MPKPLRISPIALNPTNRKVLQVAINLINDENANSQLHLEEDILAELLVIDGDDKLGQKALLESHAEQVKLVISQHRQQGDNIIWQEPPVRVADMQGLLSRICKRMQTAMPTAEPTPEPEPELNHAEQLPADATVTETSPPEPGIESHHEEDTAQTASVASLFHILLNARQQKICQQITFHDYCLFVSGQDGTAIAENAQHHQAILTAPAEQLNIEQMDVVNFAERVKGLAITPLDNLIWQAGVDHCDGQLLPGHEMGQTVRLKAWPNFTRNGFRQSHFKLATIMAKRPISLNALREESGVAVDEIISFYNAAYAVGLIDKTNMSPTRASQKSKQPPQRKGLLGKLANKFRR